MNVGGGTNVGRGYVSLEFEGDDMNEDIVDEVSKAAPGIRKEGQKHGEGYEEGFEGGFFARLRNRFQKGMSDELRKHAEADGRDTGGRLGAGIVDGLREHLDDMGFGPIREKLTADIEAITARMDDLRGRLDRSRSPNAIDKLTVSLKESRAEATRLIGQLRTLAATEARLALKQVSGNRGGSGGGDDDRLGETIGGLFGAGSRNNALNLFGKSLGGMVDLINGARKAVTPLFSAFKTGFNEAGEGANFLQKALSGVQSTGLAAGESAGKAFAALASSGPAAAVAIAAIIAAMAILVSIAGALLAIVSALAATIGSALVGAAAVAGASLAALGGVAGLVVVAFTSMTDAQRKVLSTSFQPIKEELTGIGQIVLKDLVPAFSTWADNIKTAIALAVPAAQVAGKAFADAGNILTASFSGPGFVAFSQSLAVYLPSIVHNLSMAMGSFLNGMLGLFSALMPFVNQFAIYLAQVSDRFSRFANSAAGQNAIVDFVGRALESLKSLWNFVTQFSAFVGHILFSPSAQQAGNGIFDGLADSLKRARQSISEADLQKWFADAIKFGTSLWHVMQGLGDVIKSLYDAGVLDAMTYAFEVFASVLKTLAKILDPLVKGLGHALPYAFEAAFGPLKALADGIGGLIDKVKSFLNLIGIARDDAFRLGDLAPKVGAGVGPAAALDAFQKGQAAFTKGQATGSAVNLINVGKGALAATSKDHGGTKPAWKNPYVAFANSLIAQAPGIRQQIKTAFNTMKQAFLEGIAEAMFSTDSASVTSSMNSLADQLKSGGDALVDQARSNLTQAAQELASATTKSAASKALAKVKAAQDALNQALAAQAKTDDAAKTVAAQGVVNAEYVRRLVGGWIESVGPSLADFAEARAQVAQKIADANQQLATAINTRDQYAQQVTDSMRSFASIVTAQAQTLDGVTQALTAGDVTANLQDRLDKIKAFNDNLRVLLAQGLNKDAYKQILDAGVEGGSATAQALVNGGTGAVQQINGLTSQINDLSSQMGLAAGSQMYQAGVDAAQGLVDGLLSLDAQLAAAATQLGVEIANSLKASLGIHSPSRVLRDMMNFVGDGAVLGLQDQHGKVGSAADEFARQIGISPTAAQYGSGGAGSGVSGNDPKFLWTGDFVTPTEDPKAVVQEALNELTGRLL